MGTYYWTNAAEWRAKFAESVPILRNYVAEKQAEEERIVSLSDEALKTEFEDKLRWTSSEEIRGWASNAAKEWEEAVSIQDDEEFVVYLFAQDRWSVFIEGDWIMCRGYDDSYKKSFDTSVMDAIAPFVESGSFIECQIDYDNSVWRLYWVDGKPAQTVYPSWIVPSAESEESDNV